MKAITLWEPWATLVALGQKQIETRGWTTLHRGALAIHAAKKSPDWCKSLVEKEPFKSVLCSALDVPIERPHLILDHLQSGVIIAVANLIGVYDIVDTNKVLVDGAVHVIQEPELSFGDYTPGRKAWMLPQVKRLVHPISARGYPGIWEWDAPEFLLVYLDSSDNGN